MRDSRLRPEVAFHLEAARNAEMEILADSPDGEFTEDYLSVPAPGELQHWEWVVYLRCKDLSVSADT
jgi:hypothetical protein